MRNQYVQLRTADADAVTGYRTGGDGEFEGVYSQSAFSVSRSRHRESGIARTRMEWRSQVGMP